MSTESESLLDRLVAFPTVSRDSNLALIGFVRDFLAERGISATLFQESSGGKANLFASIGPIDQPGIVLSGHSDVVPVDGQNWSSDPFQLTRRGDRLFGRGAADMKGFIACALAAIDRAGHLALRRPLHLAISHDEEIGCVGVHTMLAGLAGHLTAPLLCIVGEPTSMQLANGHKGKVALRAVCRGHAAHSAMAPNALNAIHLAADFVGILRNLQGELAESGIRDEAYDVPYSTIHIGLVQGGVALNIVPDRCQLDFEIRAIAGEDVAALLQRISGAAETLAAPWRERFPDAAISIDQVNSYPGLSLSADHPAMSLARSLTGANHLIKLDFGSEAGLFQDLLAIPTLVCGPGSMEQGHKADEFVSRDQLNQCDQMMDRLLRFLS